MDGFKIETTDKEHRKVPMSHVLISDGSRYSVNKLIEITQELPNATVELNELFSALNDSCWDDTTGEKISPASVLEIIQQQSTGSPDWEELASKHPALEMHFRRIAKADTSHPILLLENEEGIIVLDGMHRLAKLVLDGHKRISAKVLRQLPDAAEIV